MCKPNLTNLPLDLYKIYMIKTFFIFEIVIQKSHFLKLTNSKSRKTPKKRKILSASEPPVPVKEERKTALSVTMARLLERFKILNSSVMQKANEVLPHLVSLWIYFV